ncbi:FAD-dependent oxidoreductase, partial [Mycobacterium sp.]|uniref:FAD-dependent oxidoreductase n=1 Tax=Mycobacterium sp. TaxID=1785 RepID=UPI002D81CBA7|nr:FAD-dependent oxidoreductase [Mycobacterium sp.]
MAEVHVNTLGEHAVVLGAGMAGLLAARVLSDFYRTVTVVERDPLPDSPVQRKGIPQGRHLHGMLSRGSQVLEELFPGFLDEFVAAGAHVVDDGDLSRIYSRIGSYGVNRSGKFKDPAALVIYPASRPFLEFHVRRRVGALENVRFLDRCDVVEPVAATADRVTGVRVVNRDNGIGTTLATDLVVDATGRGARTPAFLENLGYGRPPELHCTTHATYSSQLLRIPDGAISEKLMMVIQPGKGKPRGALTAYENGTWMLTVGRSAIDTEPPISFSAMLTLAEQFTPPPILAGLRAATPIGEVSLFRYTGAVWRRYDRMPRFPKGLLVIGDALCSLNPIYGQGMTVAALEALALQDYLRRTDARPQEFFGAAATHIGPTWAMNQARDQAPSLSQRKRSLSRRLADWTVNKALKAAENDIVLTEALHRVTSLIDPPSRLRDPSL